LPAARRGALSVLGLAHAETFSWRRTGEIFRHDLSDIRDRPGEVVAGNDIRLQRQHDQRQRAVLAQQLAADDFVAFDRLDEFVVVGADGGDGVRGSAGAAQLHVARTVCRRAERLVIALSRNERVGRFIVQYLNRLSDALFVMARHENKRRGVPDVLWNSRA